MIIDSSVHQVTRVEVTPINCFDKEGQSGTFYRDIRIHTKDGRFELTIFSSDKTSLAIL